MQVKDIRERIVYIPPERAKSDEGEHVEIAPELEKLIQEHQPAITLQTNIFPITFKKSLFYNRLLPDAH
jgi:hypothetical protein